MSEPRVIEGYGAAELEAMLKERLENDAQPLRQTIREAIREAEAARARSRARSSTLSDGEREQESPPTVTESLESHSPSEHFRQRQESALPPAPASAVETDPDRDALRLLADIGLREFNAQLYIVQPKSKS